MILFRSVRLGIGPQSAVRSPQGGDPRLVRTPKGMPASRFRELTAYKRAREVGDEVRELVLGWESFDRWSVGIQLVRAADSVAANIAEAYGRSTLRDQQRLLLIARGSLFETEHWLETASARGLVGGRNLEPALDEATRTLNGLIRSLDGKT